MTTSVVSEVLLFFGAMEKSTETPTFTKPSVPTSDWAENVDYGHADSDFWREVCSMTWSSSGATGNMDATSTSTASTKHAFAVALKPSVFIQPIIIM